MSREENLFKTCQLVAKLEKNLSVSEMIGTREPNYQNNVEAREKILCTLQFYCDCHNCRNQWIIFLL